MKITTDIPAMVVDQQRLVLPSRRYVCRSCGGKYRRNNKDRCMEPICPRCSKHHNSYKSMHDEDACVSKTAKSEHQTSADDLRKLIYNLRSQADDSDSHAAGWRETREWDAVTREHQASLHAGISLGLQRAANALGNLIRQNS